MLKLLSSMAFLIKEKMLRFLLNFFQIAFQIIFSRSEFFLLLVKVKRKKKNIYNIKFDVSFDVRNIILRMLC